MARSVDAADWRRSVLGLTPEGPAAIRSGGNAVVDPITAVLEESFTDAETKILGAAPA